MARGSAAGPRSTTRSRSTAPRVRAVPPGSRRRARASRSRPPSREQARAASPGRPSRLPGRSARPWVAEWDANRPAIPPQRAGARPARVRTPALSSRSHLRGRTVHATLRSSLGGMVEAGRPGESPPCGRPASPVAECVTAPGTPCARSHAPLLGGWPATLTVEGRSSSADVPVPFSMPGARPNRRSRPKTHSPASVRPRPFASRLYVSAWQHGPHCRGPTMEPAAHGRPEGTDGGV
jgi:hypothetical protein